jgi:tetratricopeptide (TPR) repeat protein
MLMCAAAGFADGSEELADYEPSPEAVRLLTEFQSYAYENMLNVPSPERVTGDTEQWLARVEALAGDPPAQRYLRAWIEFEAFNNLWWSRREGPHLQRAHDHIRSFAELNVAFAAGFALYGSIVGQMIAVNPLNAIGYAGTADRVTRVALELAPDNRLAHLNRGIGLLNAPPAFGGDPERAVEAMRTAYAGDDPGIRMLAGVWLAVAYAKVGRTADATAVVEEVIELAPGYLPALATAEALALGVEPLEHWQEFRAARS